MRGKWDLVIMAFAAAGSWVLAENTHRIDLGAPDDEVVAAVPAPCDMRASLYGWNQSTIMIVDEGFQVATDASPSPPPPGCAHP
jgi:hypothetical protein